MFDEGSGGRAHLLKERVSSPGQLVAAALEVTAGGSVIDRVPPSAPISHLGREVARFAATSDVHDPPESRKVLVAAVARAGGEPRQVSEYELDVRRQSRPSRS